MRKHWKILSIAMLLLVIFIFSGCVEGVAPNTQTPTNTATPTFTPTPTSSCGCGCESTPLPTPTFTPTPTSSCGCTSGCTL